MKLSLPSMLPRINTQFQRIFPLRQRQALWQEVQPGRYHYQITADALLRALLMAFTLRLSGLREMIERLGRLLGTANFSSLARRSRVRVRAILRRG